MEEKTNDTPNTDKCSNFSLKHEVEDASAFNICGSLLTFCRRLSSFLFICGFAYFAVTAGYSKVLAGDQ